MKYLWKSIPRYIRYVIVQILFLYLFMVVFRLVFFLFFFKTTITGSAPILKAWSLGLRFDLRLALFLSIPLLITAFIARNHFFTKAGIRRPLFIYLFLVYLLLTFAYVFDLGHYAYLGLRMDPTVTRFLAYGERADNARMLWQSYPVVRTVFGIGLFLFLITVQFTRSYYRLGEEPPVFLNWKRYTGWVAALVVMFAAGIYANIAYFPLRWSQAMFTKDNGVTSLSLNPVLYYVSNMSMQKDTYDVSKTKEFYPLMSQYLGVEQPDIEKLNFVRSIPGKDGNRMNVVLVMLESTGAAVTSMYNNPMMPTPNMKRLADSGILFKNFYVPAISTARTVYGVTTGLPDITATKTASRHPQMVDQRVLMDQFKGYEKFYMLGGNTNWANIRAVFTNNVDGIRIFEEGYYKAPKADVWGVSDFDLITEADEIFRDATKRKQPFIAFLQLADNHPPYTTTKGRGDFKRVTEKDIDQEKFKKAGFVSMEQFNAIRYEDYNIGHLMELAKQGGYLENTIFIMFGDHNCTLNPYHFMPTPEYELIIGGVHATCFIYCPALAKPKVVDYAVSLVDIYPTMAKLAGVPAKNYTLGRDMLDTTITNRYAFAIYLKNLQPYMSVIGERYQYEINTSSQKSYLYDMQGDPLKDVRQQYPDTANALDNLTRAYYESTRYLMFNNKK
ncbi:LTA synthase family protein [Chitinophaga rhizophila]|uniref:LTA synthase family protein n=1 Tax=Chitinophaga rhizophila TaxID=2866212 RepID=A0ABS7G8X2_9BACT|nr:LTA synthase family protein [Chitinophaga rhizophila]MBW8684094.1 LTA synthase family protein [Chitinophaga rhizophila]